MKNDRTRQTRISLPLLALSLSSLLPSAQAWAMEPVEGWVLSPLKIIDATQSLDNWDSNKLQGTTLIQYTSVRWGAETQNPEILHKLQRQQDCDAVTIINFNDDLPGVRLAARKQAIAVQQAFPDCKVVADAHGLGLVNWQMPRDKNITLIVNADGKVLFKREGKLSEDEQRHVEYLLDV
ncbi:MAG: hypothetical protein HRU20_23110 [Pseudomonadales bacterium]|nr:hypothetical protein [Pseudomonadales bacterium]